MQQDVLLHYWVISNIKMRLEYEIFYIVVQWSTLTFWLSTHKYGKQHEISQKTQQTRYFCIETLFVIIKFGNYLRLFW